MKVSTLLKAMMYEIDEVEWYDDNMNLISRMSPKTLASEYADCRIKKFWIYTDEDGLITLEIIFK